MMTNTIIRKMSLLILLAFPIISIGQNNDIVEKFISSLIKDSSLTTSKVFLTERCVKGKRLIPLDKSLLMLRKRIIDAKSYKVLLYKEIEKSPDILKANSKDRDLISVIKIVEQNNKIQYIYVLKKGKLIDSFSVILKGGNEIVSWE